MKTGDPSTPPFILSLPPPNCLADPPIFMAEKENGGLRTGPPVVLCIGPEGWMKARYIRQLKARCITPGFEEMDLVVFSEPPDEGRQILEVALTAPFGSSCRLVVVDGLETIDEKTLPWLPGYLKSPHPKTCLVLCGQRLEREMEARFLHKKDHAIQILWCRSLKGAQLKDWIVAQAQHLGK